MSRVTFLVVGQSCGASRGRVCYQQGQVSRLKLLDFSTIRVFECSCNISFSSFVTFLVFQFCNKKYILSIVTIWGFVFFSKFDLWVLFFNKWAFEFVFNLSFQVFSKFMIFFYFSHFGFLNFEFCHKLSFSVLFLFESLIFLNIFNFHFVSFCV